MGTSCSINKEGKSAVSEDWKSVDPLIKDIELSMKNVLNGGGLQYEMSGGVLNIDKDMSGYKGHLLIDGNAVHDFSTNSIGEIVTSLMVGGWLQPKCSAKNSEHVDYLNQSMEKMEMSLSEDLFNDEAEEEEKELKTGEDSITEDDKDTDKDGEHDDEEILQELSSDEFDDMDADRQELVKQLMDKHNTNEPPQISDYPDGGHEVRVFGDNGFYYYYLITPDDEVVHLAIMGKTMKNKLGPNMEDMVKKSTPNFVNDFNFFSKADQDKKSLKKTLILGDSNLLYPEETDYETGIGNNVTVTLKNAIMAKGDELKASLDSITNNNDGTYKVVFAKYPMNEIPSFTTPTLVAFNVDRDGNFTSTSTEVTMMKSTPIFKDYNFTKTTDELNKSLGRKIILRKKEDIVQKSKPVSKEFLTEAPISALLEDRKKEVLKAQINNIKNPMTAKVNW